MSKTDRADRIKKLHKQWENWTGDDGDQTFKVEVEIPEELLFIGWVTRIEYRRPGDEDVVNYHDFDQNNLPWLGGNVHGNLAMIGGGFTFKTSGNWVGFINKVKG
jgi:hypothetical protein